MSEHTPGPWHVAGKLVADADGDIVANEIDSRESLNLIAAAPDMEKALVVMGELLVAAEEFMVSYHSRACGHSFDNSIRRFVWQGRFFLISNGSTLLPYSPAKRVILGERGATTAKRLKAFYGIFAQGLLGVIYPPSSGIGTPSTAASAAGLRVGHLTAYLRPLTGTLICAASWWTGALRKYINMALAPQKRLPAG